MHRRLTQIVDSYLAFSERRGVLIIIAALALGVLAALAAQRLRIDARMESLLPEGTPSQRAVEELRARTSLAAPLYLLVSSSDASANRQLARQLRREVEAWPETIWAIDRRDPTFFRDRLLLFAPTDRLERLTRRVERLVRWEECEAAIACVNIIDRPEVPTRDDVEALFDDVAEADSLVGLFGSATDSLQETRDDDADVGERDSAADSAGGEARIGDLCNDDGSVCVVHAVLTGLSSDVEFSQGIFERAQSLLEELRPAEAPPDLRLVVGGQFRVMPMTHQIVGQDLRLAGLLGTLLVVLVVAVQFRGLRSLILLLVPIVLSVAWTMGLLGLFEARLNLISASVLVLLVGLGVDFGVHTLTQYGSRRAAGLEPRGALRASMLHLWRPMLIAALTTACGFGALAAARFRGFAEMGPIGALGVSLAFVSFLLLFPPLTLALHRLRRERRTLLRPMGLRLPVLARAPATLIALVGLATAVGLGVLAARGLSFEYDFGRLRPQAISHGIGYLDATHGTSRTAVYLLSDDAASLEAAAGDLRDIVEADRPDEHPRIVTPRSFVPIDQSARIELIERLRVASDRVRRRGSAETLERLDELNPYLGVERPIVAEELPGWVRGAFAERDGNFGRLGVIFAGGSGSDAREMEQLAAQIDGYRRRHPEIRFASARALLGEVVPSLRRDAPVIIGLALLGLLVATLLAARSVGRTALVGLTLLVAACATAGVLTLLDLRISLYNMLVFPLAFGIGVDGAVYVIWSGGGGSDDHDQMPTAIRAVLGSTLTDAAAFASLTVAAFPGLVVLGQVALVALACTLASNLVWLPAVMRAAQRRALWSTTGRVQ